MRPCWPCARTPQPVAGDIWNYLVQETRPSALVPVQHPGPQRPFLRTKESTLLADVVYRPPAIQPFVAGVSSVLLPAMRPGKHRTPWQERRFAQLRWLQPGAFAAYLS